MATITVQIAANGTPSPSHINVSGGDSVCFQTEVDAVLCVDPESLFGSERFEIPGGDTVCLAVLPNPPATFEYLTRMGDLTARCDDGRGTGGTGGGSGEGGGPG